MSIYSDYTKLIITRGKKNNLDINESFSKWRSKNSFVSYRLALEPILFYIFINDLEEKMHDKLSKFADDTKLFQVVKCQADGDKLQEEFASLHEWAEKW